MLPKVHRLSQDKQIQQAFRTKYRYQTENFRIFVSPTQNLEFKLLIIIPKKIFKRANKRNRLRRKVSAVFENLLLNKRLPPQTTCILQITKQNALYKNIKEIQDEVIPQVSNLYIKTINQTHTFKTKNILPS